MTPIIWGRERPYAGNGDCPAEATDVACAITLFSLEVAAHEMSWLGAAGHRAGRYFNWPEVTAYRLPAWFDAMEDARGEGPAGNPQSASKRYGQQDITASATPAMLHRRSSNEKPPREVGG